MPDTRDATTKILGLCGSLRAQSYNLAALKTAGELMPEGMTLEIGSIRELPLYDADLQAKGLPEPVTRLSDQIRAADAVLIASPEYNFSVPGVLKNAIDWVSRVKDQPFNDKAVAIMGASMGPLGTGRMQYDLRKILLFLNANALVKPEVFIGSAQTKFDEQGRLTDESTRKFIADQMQALRRWAQRINGSRQAVG
ncbi:MAG TPA: NADPH-dependent FMN reductase [Burkholderiaceae bacterium]|nr:NADPH-dependent FMN reductase [Burkholderiaceae bacterium]